MYLGFLRGQWIENERERERKREKVRERVSKEIPRALRH